LLIKLNLRRRLLQIEEVVQAFYQINLRVQVDQNIIDFIVDSHLTIIRALLKIIKDLIVVLYPLVILTEDKPQVDKPQADKLRADRNLQSLFRTNLVTLIQHLATSLRKI
jgi:hypothetical protein